MNNGITSLEQEIQNLQRQIDDLEWEGVFCDHMQRQLDRMIHDLMNGELYYVNF